MTDTSTKKEPPQKQQNTITLDLGEYLHHLDGLGLTDEQALNCLNELYELALQLIYYGYNIHPLQQAEKACGQSSKLAEKAEKDSPNELSLLGQFIKENMPPSPAPETARAKEGVIHEGVIHD